MGHRIFRLSQAAEAAAAEGGPRERGDEERPAQLRGHFGKLVQRTAGAIICWLWGKKLVLDRRCRES